MKDHGRISKFEPEKCNKNSHYSFKNISLFPIGSVPLANFSHPASVGLFWETLAVLVAITLIAEKGTANQTHLVSLN